MKLILALLIMVMSVYAKSSWYTLESIDSLYELKGTPFSLNADTSKCELLFVTEDSITAKRFPVCKSFNVSTDSASWMKLWNKYLNVNVFKLPIGIYYVIDSTGNGIQSVKIIGDSTIIEAESDRYIRYKKIKSQWYTIQKSSSGVGESYYSDSTYRGIEHTLMVNVSSDEDTLGYVTKKWYTKSYYKATETPTIKYADGTEQYSYSTNWDSSYTNYTNNLNGECNISCFGNSCTSTQTFPELNCNDGTCDTVNVDTVSTYFENKNGTYVKKIYNDTIVHTITNAVINYNHSDETKTSLNVVLVVDNTTKYDLCSSKNSNEYYGYKPVSIYGSIDGIDVEGTCTLSDSKTRKYTCNYKDNSGSKYGKLKETYPDSFNSSDAYAFLCKDGKTSDGKYLNCSKVGL